MSGGRWQFEAGRIWTPNLVPGKKVYGESLRSLRGREHRSWNPRRSKLAAYLAKGGKGLRLNGDEHVLYLGAASGTTVSHLSDLLVHGRIVAVEFSARPFRNLIDLATGRANIVPVLADARHPEAYDAYLERPADVVVQDIAQPDPGEILARNVERLARPGGAAWLAVKARSVDVAADPRKVYGRVRKGLEERGMRVADQRELDPYEQDHALFVLET